MFIENFNICVADCYDNLILMDDALKASDHEPFCEELVNAEFPEHNPVIMSCSIPALNHFLPSSYNVSMLQYFESNFNGHSTLEGTFQTSKIRVL